MSKDLRIITALQPINTANYPHCEIAMQWTAVKLSEYLVKYLKEKKYWHAALIDQLLKQQSNARIKHTA